MDFKLTEMQQDIANLAKDFATKKLAPTVKERDEKEVFDRSILDEMGSLGLLGIPWEEENGGVGADFLSLAVACEEVAKVDPSIALSFEVHTMLCSWPIWKFGTAEQKQKFLKPLAEGTKLGAFGLTEPNAGTDALNGSTTAVKEGDYYILNGRKCFISGAPLADYCIVYAKTDMTKGNKGISAFIVDMKAPGVSCGKHEAKMGLVGYATSDVVLEDVRVHKSDMLGKENMGFINAMKTLDGGRLGVSAQSIGLAQGCLDEAIKYSKERVQFGKPICKNQAIAFMLADMATKLTAAKELVYMAAQMKDRNDPNASMYCSMAKYFASETCNEIAAKAVQIHGGYGYIKEYPVERKYRDCRVFTIYEGTSQVQQMVISGNLLK